MQGVADILSKAHAQHAPSASAGMRVHRLRWTTVRMNCAGCLARWHLAVSVSNTPARLQSTIKALARCSRCSSDCLIQRVAV